MEANRDGTATLANVKDALDSFSELNDTPIINPSAATDILCHMGLSRPLNKEKNVFLFPALIQDCQPDAVWTRPECPAGDIAGMVYVGIRLRCLSDIEIFSPAVMPLLQCDAANRQDEMVVVMWNGGMLVERVCEAMESKVEALVRISDKKRAIHALDLIARGPAHCHHDVKQFVDKVQQMSMRILDRKCPGTRVEKQYLSHRHIREHVDHPISYSEMEVAMAKQDNGVMMRTSETGTVKDSVIDLLAVDDDHIIYKLQSLSRHCSSHWLEFGRILLSNTTDEVRHLASAVGAAAGIRDIFCHVMETWIQKQWRTASLQEFLNACDRVGDGIRQQVIEELIYIAQDHGYRQRLHLEDRASRVFAAVVEHGVDRWFSLCLDLGFTAAQVNNMTSHIPNNADKIRAVFEEKCQLIGREKTADALMEACEKAEIVGAVQEVLTEDAASSEIADESPSGPKAKMMKL